MRTILTIVGVYLLIRVATRFFSVYKVVQTAKKEMRNHQEAANKAYEAQNDTKQSNDELGEYVDFEEIPDK
jgi:uncharacterized membrane protein (DUF106 family)